MSAQEHSRADVLLNLADDELILGWRNSEWTGIAPFLEEDVAFSSIAQNEIGHARALYELAATDLGTTADELALDREPGDYRCAQLVQLDLVPDWAATVARHFLYETADAVRIEALKGSDDPAVAGIAEKIDREEVYHRIHADMWIDRLGHEAVVRAALERLWGHALGVLDEPLRPELERRLRERLGWAPGDVTVVERGDHLPELTTLWEEMTMVRRSAPAGSQW